MISLEDFMGAMIVCPSTEKLPTRAIYTSKDYSFLFVFSIFLQHVSINGFLKNELRLLLPSRLQIFHLSQAPRIFSYSKNSSKLAFIVFHLLSQGPKTFSISKNCPTQLPVFPSPKDPQAPLPPADLPMP